MPFLGPLPQVGAAGGILLIEQLLDKIAAVVLLGLLLLLFITQLLLFLLDERGIALLRIVLEELGILPLIVHVLLLQVFALLSGPLLKCLEAADAFVVSEVRVLLLDVEPIRHRAPLPFLLAGAADRSMTLLVAAREAFTAGIARATREEWPLRHGTPLLVRRFTERIFLLLLLQLLPLIEGRLISKQPATVLLSAPFLSLLTPGGPPKLSA